MAIPQGSANGMWGIGLHLYDLIHDFPRGEVAAKTHSARGAEHTTHRAADLGTDAGHILEVVRPVQQWNADRLKPSRSLALKQILGESVLRRDDFLYQRQMGDHRQGEQAIPQPGVKVAARGG
jgi:hypothetical protein